MVCFANIYLLDGVIYADLPQVDGENAKASDSQDDESEGRNRIIYLAEMGFEKVYDSPFEQLGPGRFTFDRSRRGDDLLEQGVLLTN